MTLRLWISWFLLGLALVACGGTGADQQTLAAHDDSLSTQFAAIRITATTEAERYLSTAEFSQTRIARVFGQRGEMISTLEARGVDTSILPGAVTFEPTTPPLGGGESNVDIQTQTLIAPIITPAGAQTTPLAATPSATAGSTQPSLTTPVMSTSVGDDDCAVGVTGQFTPAAERIYVVSIATNIQPGMTIRSHWRFGDQEIAVFDFTPDFEINGACVWFYADQSDFIFTPGSYTVTLDIDGVASGVPAAFTILGATSGDQ
jgi:hypothetical protein